MCLFFVSHVPGCFFSHRSHHTEDVDYKDKKPEVECIRRILLKRDMLKNKYLWNCFPSIGLKSWGYPFKLVLHRNCVYNIINKIGKFSFLLNQLISRELKAGWILIRPYFFTKSEFCKIGYQQLTYLTRVTKEVFLFVTDRVTYSCWKKASQWVGKAFRKIGSGLFLQSLFIKIKTQGLTWLNPMNEESKRLFWNLKFVKEQKNNNKPTGMIATSNQHLKQQPY